MPARCCSLNCTNRNAVASGQTTKMKFYPIYHSKQYGVLPHNMEIISSPHIAVTSPYAISSWFERTFTLTRTLSAHAIYWPKVSAMSWRTQMGPARRCLTPSRPSRCTQTWTFQCDQQSTIVVDCWVLTALGTSGVADRCCHQQTDGWRCLYRTRQIF